MLTTASRTALTWALRWLERRDVERLVVAALDTCAVAVALWLLRGDAYPLGVDERRCLHVAAGDGCWTATALLLRRLYRAAANTNSSATPWEQAMSTHASTHVVFPAAVMYRAATRGELRHVQWLHGTTEFETPRAVQRAAEARQLGVVQWLLDHVRDGEKVQCWLRYDASHVDVRGIGWIHQSDEQVFFCSVSDAHGFSQRVENLWDPDARVPDLPLAEPFAREGNLPALQKLLVAVRGDEPRLFSRYTIVHAAGQGHLDVVQWLHSLSIHSWPLVTAMGEAAANGCLAVVQWLFQFPETRVPDVMKRAIEGGHLHIARWLLSRDCPLLNVPELLYWPAAARSMDVSVLKYVKEELGLAVDPISALFIGFTGDQTLVEYVVDHVLPIDQDYETLVFHTAKNGTLDALEYLVDTKGFWSRKAFRVAIERPANGRAFAQWIYQAAKTRSERQGEPLETVIDFSEINVFKVALDTSVETALWLVENVPEIAPHGFIVSVGEFHPDRLPHTRTRLLDDDLLLANPSIHAADVDALLTACVGKRPDACMSIPWLPQWAIRTNAQQVFDWLVEQNHPAVFTTDTRDCIIAFSRNVYFMNVLLAFEPPSLYAPSVAAWATSYGLLDHLLIPED